VGDLLGHLHNPRKAGTGGRLFRWFPSCTHLSAPTTGALKPIFTNVGVFACSRARPVASGGLGDAMLRRLRQGCLRVASAMLLVTGSVHSVVAQTEAPATALAPFDASAEQPQPPPPAGPGPGDLGFRFHGYLRSGFGVDGTGKGQQPFIAPLAGSKYRLGNEAETYMESTFNYGATSEGDDPAYFDTRVTLAYVTPTSQSNTFATTFSLREGYGIARRIWAAQPEATFWAGARFYDRSDVHITDFWYRDPSGFGGGIEDVALGDRSRLAVAWIGGTQDQLDPNGTVPKSELFRFNKNTFDIKFYGWQVGRARASVAIDLSTFNGDEVTTSGAPIVVEDSFGTSGTAFLELPFTGGRNKTSLQYGTGAAYDFRSVLTPPAGRTFVPGEHVRTDDLWQVRILDDFLLEQRGPWALQLLALYQQLENGADSNSRIHWVSLGGRPVRRLGRFFSLATEAGWDYTVQGDLPGGSLFKLTVAPQITPEMKFLSRPSLRAFATWAHWSDTFRGSIAATTDPNAVHGAAFGVQLETWW
jgi:maltoporin